MKILLIEDNIYDRLILQRRLREHNPFDSIYYETTDSLDKAKEIISWFNPDIITLDLSLGEDTTESVISHIPIFRAFAPLIVISGSFEDQPELKKLVKIQGASLALDKMELSSQEIALRVFSLLQTEK